MQNFINNILDHSDTEARTPIKTLFAAYAAQAVGIAVRTARLRDFEQAVRSAGYPVGTVGSVKFVGGLQIFGTAPRPKRHWIITPEGFMRLADVEVTGSAFARDRGLAEAAGAV